MRYSRSLIAMLLLATALVDAVAISNVTTGSWATWQWQWPSFGGAALLSLASGQVGLLAIWAGMGKKSSPWRLTGTILLNLLWIAILGEGGLHTVELFWWLFAQAFFILLPLSVARILRVRLAMAAAVNPPPAPDDLLPWQFTLRDIFAWTTAVAIVLGAFKGAVPGERLCSSTSPEIVESLVLGGCNAALAFAGLWAALSKAPLLRRWVPPTVVLLLLAAFLAAIHVDADHAYALAVLFVLEMLLVIGSLWVFRVAGYRLRVIRRTT
jgi:hypothetical protein